MHRPALPFLVAGLLVLAGCAGSPGTGPSPAPSPSSSPSPATLSPAPAPTQSPTATATRSPEPVSVGYVVRAGEVPDGFRSLNVTLAVVFADDENSLVHCDGDLLRGPHEPTPTPTPTPYLDRDLDCVRYGNLTVDLTELDGERSLGEFTAPGRVAGAHALVVRDVVGVLENGTRVSRRIYDDDFRAHVVRSAGGGSTYGVELDVRRLRFENTPPPEVPRYETGVGRFEPTVEPGTGRALAVEGTVAADSALALRVTRDGEPASVPIEVTGAADGPYRTGPDGTVEVRIASPEVVEIEVGTGNS